MMGAAVEVNPRGLADSIEQVMVPAPPPSSSGPPPPPPPPSPGSAAPPARPAAAGRTRRCRGRTSAAGSAAGRSGGPRRARRHLDQRLARRGTKASATESPAVATISTVRSHSSERHLAPDAERRVAAGLEPDRAVVHRLQPGVEGRPDHQDERHGGEAERRGARASEARASCARRTVTPCLGTPTWVTASGRARNGSGRPIGQQHRREHERGELRPAWRGDSVTPRHRVGEQDAASPPGARRPGRRWSRTPGRRRCRGRRPSRRRGSRARRAAGRARADADAEDRSAGRR